MPLLLTLKRKKQDSWICSNGTYGVEAREFLLDKKNGTMAPLSILDIYIYMRNIEPIFQ